MVTLGSPQGQPIADLAQRVEAEGRCDTFVDATSLTMLPDGRFTSEFGSLPITERALEGLARLVLLGTKRSQAAARRAPLPGNTCSMER